MIPRSMDTQTRAHDLSTSILSSSTPPQISSALSSLSSFILRHSPDQLRPFFSLAFPSLLSRLFGFDNSPSWLDLAASDPALSSQLLDLLSPPGVLLSSLLAADLRSLLRYVFPLERLPEWIRFALQSDKHISALPNLCPLFKNRIKEDPIQGSYQLQLSIFEYYMFWFAYYPVCKGNNENSDTGVVRKSRRFRLENWKASLPALVSPSKRPGQKSECNLYLRLLYAYLNVFVPKCGVGAYQPYRSSLLHYSSGCDGSAFAQAEFVVYALVEFWLVDNDFSPVPVGVCRSLGFSFPNRAVLGETPPTAGLGEVVKLLVKYLNWGVNGPVDGQGEVFKISGLVDGDKSRSAVVSYESLVGSWNSVIQRPLYRFILRTLLFCPMAASIKNAAEVFSVWVTYMVPWKISDEDFAIFEAPPACQNSQSLKKENLPDQGKIIGGKEGSEAEAVYTPIWESYVASNYLFYSSLVVHFLGFAHKFLHTNVDAVIQMVLKVLNILTSSTELLDLLRRVDAAYHSQPTGPSLSSVDSVHKYVPSLREKLQDWEDGLCENDADGSFLHENWNQDLRLFSDAEDGAPKLLQLFVLRAEHEIHIMSGDPTQNLQALDSIRSDMKALFGGSIRSSHSPSASPEANSLHRSRGEVFTPKHPGVGQRTWADIKYKGDWMRRPISDTEVAWLARLMIRLSDWLNEVLGLNRVDKNESAGLTYVEVNDDEVVGVGGFKEALYMVVSLLGSWLALFAQVVVNFMRGHGIRINLRILASKKFVMALVAYAVYCALKKAIRAASAASSPP